MKLKIAKNVKIGKNSIIYDDVIIEENVIISDLVVIGSPPQSRRKREIEKGPVLIRKGTIIREFTEINSPLMEEMTLVGENCYLMGHTHVGHDCKIFKNVTIAHGASLSGHTRVANNAFLGLESSTHQGVTIGECAMIGMNSTVISDVLPFSLVHGTPAKCYSINKVGIIRNYSKDILNELYKIFDSRNQEDIIKRGLNSENKIIFKAFEWFKENYNRRDRDLTKFAKPLKFNNNTNT